MEKYCNPDITTERQQESYNELLSRARELAATRPGTCWDLGKTLSARAKLAKGKSSGGDDSVVAEMVQHLPWLAMLQVHNMFVDRFRGDLSGEPHGWRKAHVIYLAKCSTPEPSKTSEASRSSVFSPNGTWEGSWN